MDGSFQQKDVQEKKVWENLGQGDSSGGGGTVAYRVLLLSL